MTYDINTMPANLEEWNELITFKTNEAKSAYDAAVAAAKAQAEAAYAELPETEDKPTLADFIAQATSSIPQPETREDFERMYACYYPQPEPEPEPAPTTEQLFDQLRSYREVRLREYDQKIAQLDRLIRLNPDYAAYTIERAEWDAYAVELCNLPAQDGAPWDGGGSETPWPKKPE